MTGTDFWSRRKALVDAEAREEERKADLEAQEAEQAALDEKTDEEILKELDLPDPETLEAGDDFKAFLSAAVPNRLKRVALRRLWSVNPVLANLDGLVDYGEDYTDAATVLETLTSTYQVGKGMKAHVEEMMRQAEAEAESEGREVESEPEVEPEEPAPVQVAELDQNEEQVPADEPELDTADPKHGTDEIISYAKPKRMRYSFE